jgi:heptosyltransferase I
MGDLVLTLPCDSIIQDEYKTHWAIPEGFDFVVDATHPKKEYFSLSNRWSWSRFIELIRHIRRIKPHTSVSFHVPWWVNGALWLCRVKVRGGVQSQWHSYLFLNKGLRQKRSQVQAHEMEYNYQLVEYVFDKKRNRDSWKPIELNAPTVDLPFDVQQNYFIVHPGMGGSALNWPTQSYAQLIEHLTEKAPVVITGTKSDEAYLAPLKDQLKENHKVVWLDKQLNGSQLLKLLKYAKATIAPSTGVLHLSASLGAASLGIYSPIKVHTDARWGPKGPKTKSFTPAVQCPAQFECLGKACHSYFCMESLSVNPVAKKALSYL